MARCIFSSFLPLSLALPGMGMKRAGFDFLFTLRMMAGPFQHFSSILDAWRYSLFVKLSEREGFRGVQFADFQGALQLLNCSHLREREIKCCYEPFCVREFGTDSFLVRPRRMMFLVSFVVRGMVMGIYFESAPFLLDCM